MKLALALINAQLKQIVNFSKSYLLITCAKNQRFTDMNITTITINTH